MINRNCGVARRVLLGSCVCLFATGVSLAEADGHAGGAPAAAAPAHAASAAPSSVTAAGRSNTVGQVDANRGATVGTVNPQADHRRGEDSGEDNGRGGDHHSRNPNNYYPLGAAYSYFYPGWNAYGYGYGYNQPTYPAQIDQQDTAVAEPSEPPDDVIPPPVPDSVSPTLRTALMASPQWRAADEQVHVAQAEYDAAASRVLAQLRTQPSYQSAVQLKRQDAQQVASMKAKDPDPSLAKAEPAAMAKLDAAKTVTDLKTAALQADPQASAAKAKLDMAIAQRLEARHAVEAQFPKGAAASPGGQ